jgi:hypothetical protein
MSVVPNIAVVQWMAGCELRSFGIQILRFEVLMAVKMLVLFFQVVMPCS